MKPKTRRKIALLVESSRSYGRGLLRGIAKYSHTVGTWAIRHQEMSADSTPPDWLDSWKPDGILARVQTPEMAKKLSEFRCPIVELRCLFKLPGVQRVDTNDQMVARLAFSHLWEKGFRRFAFCGFENANYSQNRLRYFKQFVEQSGNKLNIYQSPGGDRDRTFFVEQSGMLDEPQVVQWLKSLVPPTGLFVCNDIRGQQVLLACQKSGVSVPEDLGVVGVDNDDVVGPLCDPPLSSIVPNTHQVGYMAAEHLDELIEQGKKKSTLNLPLKLIPPLGVVERDSTRIIAVEDRIVAKACQFIRQNVTSGINVGHVAENLELSRRQLERRFKSSLGTTPLQEITRQRVDRVKRLLTETDLSLEILAAHCGFLHVETMQTVFKREIGISPGAFRNQQRTSQNQS